MRQQIDSFIPTIAQAVISDELKQATQLMNASRWREALKPLQSALERHPGIPIVRFYLALCYDHLKDVNMTERTAREALAWLDDRQRFARDMLPSEVTEENHIRSQLAQLLQQVEMGRTKADLDKAVAAVNRKDWPGALGYLDTVLRRTPDVAVAWYYKAACHLNQDNWDETESACTSALTHCRPEDTELAEQVRKLRAQVPAKPLREPMTLMNRGDWLGSIQLLDAEIERRTGHHFPNAGAHTRRLFPQPVSEQDQGALYYYRALCQHQWFMSALPPGGLSRHEAAGWIDFYEAKVTPDIAKAMASELTEDPMMPTKISNLATAVADVLRQLHSIRGY